MIEPPVPLEQDEHLLGQWAVAYLPPCGTKYPGRLWITDRQLIFAGEITAEQLHALVTGLMDSARVAYALDLDADQVMCEEGRLCLRLLKANIESVSLESGRFPRSVCVKIRDNGSTHLFEPGVFAARNLARAIDQQGCSQ